MKVCSAPETNCSCQNGACQHKSAKNLKKYMYVEFDSAGPANDDGAAPADALLSTNATSSFTTEVLYSGSGSGGHLPCNACAYACASFCKLSTGFAGFSADSSGFFLLHLAVAAFFPRLLDACAYACACIVDACAYACAYACACSQVAFCLHQAGHLPPPLRNR